MASIALQPAKSLSQAEGRAAWWGVVSVFIVHGLVVSTWVSRIVAVKAALRLSDGALGMALLGTAIGSLVAIPVSGWAVSRYGSRRTVQWSAAGFALSLLPLALAPNVYALFAANFLYGAMAGANDVAINAQAVGVEKRLGTHTMSRFHAMFSLGGILGSLVGGAAAAHSVAVLIHFLIMTAVIMAGIAVTRQLLIETGSGAPEHDERVSLRRIPPMLIALSAIGFCIFLSEGAMADWTNVYLKQVLSAPEGLAAMAYAVFSTTMTVFRFLGDAITARLGRSRTIRVGALVAASGLLLAVAAPSPYPALVGFAIVGAGFSSIIPVVFAAGGRVPSVPEGAGVATVSGLGYLGFLVGPPAIGFLSQVSSLRVGLMLLVLLSLVAAGLVSAIDGYNDR